jgi:hypothetical protein
MTGAVQTGNLAVGPEEGIRRMEGRGGCGEWGVRGEGAKEGMKKDRGHGGVGSGGEEGAANFGSGGIGRSKDQGVQMEEVGVGG